MLPISVAEAAAIRTVRVDRVMTGGNMGTDLGAFGMLINALDGNRGGDGDTGASFPRSDATDLNNGARFIPGEVTLARRASKKVEFKQPCQNACCWYWQMPDGSRIYHYDEMGHEQLKASGTCKNCGNDFISGGTMSAEQAKLSKQKKAESDTSKDGSVRKFAADAMEVSDRVIYDQESAGQQQFVNSDTLPVEIDAESKKKLEAAGVKFGKAVEGDELFLYVDLPNGWKKVPTDHSMWSHLVDDKGTVRAEIFYKAAFYDRRAFARAR
jgi:hypothetical protein